MESSPRLPESRTTSSSGTCLLHCNATRAEGLVFAYLIRRLLISIPLLVGILCLSFVMLKLAPGEPTVVQQDLQARATGAQRETLRQLYGLDRPVYEQFGRWLWRVVRLDFGRSYSPDGRLVVDKIAERIP